MQTLRPAFRAPFRSALLQRTCFQAAVKRCGAARLTALRSHSLRSGSGPRTDNAQHSTPSLEDLISTQELHVWWLFPDEVGDGYGSDSDDILNAHELEKIAAAVDGTERRLRRLTQLFLRRTLAHYLDVAPQDITFVKSARGKPHICAATHGDRLARVQFNLTNTPAAIGLAVAYGRQVGLDVERHSRITRFDALTFVKKRLSDAEYAHLSGIQDIQQRQRELMAVWTLKEAYTKAIGRGVFAPPFLRTFSAVPCCDDAMYAVLADMTAIPIATSTTLRRIEFSSTAEDVSAFRMFLFSPCDDVVATLCFEQLPPQSSTRAAHGADDGVMKRQVLRMWKVNGDGTLSDTWPGLAALGCSLPCS